jgi:hypothetical protein
MPTEEGKRRRVGRTSWHGIHCAVDLHADGSNYGPACQCLAGTLSPLPDLRKLVGRRKQ